jgi:hypothetical protein
MWTCPNCSNQAEAAVEVCPKCGAVDVELSAADEPLAAPPCPAIPEAETPTEYELQAFPDPGPSTVECHLAVLEREASAVASGLRDLGISVSVSRDDSGEGPVHRIRVPLVDLPRALAVIDLLHRRRPGRP